MAKIRWTEEASTCLESIHQYISEFDPTAAQSTVVGIYDKIQILLEFPRMGHLYRSEDDGEVRTLLYGHYRIGYQLVEQDSIVVLGIFHGSMPIEKWLK